MKAHIGERGQKIVERLCTLWMVPMSIVPFLSKKRSLRIMTVKLFKVPNDDDQTSNPDDLVKRKQHWDKKHTMLLFYAHCKS